METIHNRNTLDTQGYKVENTQTGEQIANICSIFKYKGFEIRFSTHDYDKTSAAVHRVALFHDNPAYFNINGRTYPSVEDAIKAADNICSIINYRGFEIRFSSTADHLVALFHDNPAYFNISGKTYPSVEDAIKAADHFLQNS